jgi:hypothetical protein
MCEVKKDKETSHKKPFRDQSKRRERENKKKRVKARLMS